MILVALLVQRMSVDRKLKATEVQEQAYRNRVPLERIGHRNGTAMVSTMLLKEQK